MIDATSMIDAQIGQRLRAARIAAIRQRLLECWLPLAQHISEDLG